MTHLARWLGPWADDATVPCAADRRSVTVPARDGRPPFELWVYRPHGPVRGAYLVAPGLHYAGPADPRVDRFLRVLARAGFVAGCPFLPDFADLRARETAIADFARAFDIFVELPDLRGRRPGLFSISFGSLPALRLASDPRYAERVAGVVTFGGFADFRDVVRFALQGEPGLPFDRLNQPVVVMNLLREIADVPDGLAEIVVRWRAYVEATWGREDMRTTDAWRAVAERHGEGLTCARLAFYRMGTGLEDGALDACLAAIERFDESRAYLDPRPHLSGLRSPVHVVHGVDDDVIPHGQLDKLLAAMPAHIEARGYRTGLFAHSHSTGVGGLREGAREVATLVAMLRAMTTAGR